MYKYKYTMYTIFNTINRQLLIKNQGSQKAM